MDIVECQKKMGSNIKKYRNIVGVTQEKLAEAVERSPSHINKTENGHTMPSIETILKIADTLNVGLDRLFSDVLNNKEDMYAQELLKYQSDFTNEQRNTIFRLFTTLLKVLKERKFLK